MLQGRRREERTRRGSCGEHRRWPAGQWARRMRRRWAARRAAAQTGSAEGAGAAIRNFPAGAGVGRRLRRVGAGAGRVLVCGESVVGGVGGAWVSRVGGVGVDVGVLEEIEVAILGAAERSLRFVEDELLAGERAGGDVEPAILERAFDETHSDAGGESEQAEADGPAGGSAVGCEGDGI